MTTPTRPSSLVLPEGYADWLAQFKVQIVQARQRTSLSVNAEQVQLYGRIGRDILERQQTQGWGAKVIDRLALDLKAAFADMRGWSSSNLKYMRFFAQHCLDGLFGQQPADQLPWFHIVTVLTQLDNALEREWYAVQTVEHGWSRTTLSLNIKNRLHLRQGAAVTNFKARLPAPDSALAHDTLKNPYMFDFLGLGNEAHEREIESGLIKQHKTTFTATQQAGKLAFMKTTLDLPDELVREMKLRAVMQGRTLRDLAADFIRQGLGLAAPKPPQAPPPGSRVQISVDGMPIIRGEPDAPAQRMSPEALIALEQALLTQEDMQRAGLPV